MIIGSILKHFSTIEMSTADNRRHTLRNNSFTRLVLSLIGIPHLGFRLRARIILAEAFKEATPASRILDAGCGFGMYSMILAEKGFTVDSIDLDKVRTDSIRTMLSEYPVIGRHITPFTGSLTNLPFVDNSYDLTICSEVIEHIPEHITAIRELARTLKPGGLLILSVPYHSRHNERFHKKFGHERPGYTLEQFQKLFGGVGLEVQKYFYYERAFGSPLFRLFNSLHAKPLMGIFFYPFYALYLLDYKLGIGQPNQIVVTARKL